MKKVTPQREIESERARRMCHICSLRAVELGGGMDQPKWKQANNETTDKFFIFLYDVLRCLK